MKKKIILLKIKLFIIRIYYNKCPFENISTESKTRYLKILYNRE